MYIEYHITPEDSLIDVEFVSPNPNVYVFELHKDLEHLFKDVADKGQLTTGCFPNKTQQNEAD